MGATNKMDDGVTVQILASELKRQGAALRKHVQECTSIRKETAVIRKETAEAVEALNQRLEFIDTLNRWIHRISKHGRRVVGAVALAAVTAWASILTQNYLLHRDTEKTASVAASAATEASVSQKELIKQVDQAILAHPASSGDAAQ